MAAGSRTHAARHMARHMFVEPLSTADLEAVRRVVDRRTAEPDDPAFHIVVEPITIVLIAGDRVSLRRAQGLLAAIIASTGRDLGGATWETFDVAPALAAAPHSSAAAGSTAAVSTNSAAGSTAAVSPTVATANMFAPPSDAASSVAAAADSNVGTVPPTRQLA